MLYILYIYTIYIYTRHRLYIYYIYIEYIYILYIYKYVYILYIYTILGLHFKTCAPGLTGKPSGCHQGWAMDDVDVLMFGCGGAPRTALPTLLRSSQNVPTLEHNAKIGPCTAVPVLLKDGNCNYCDTSSMAERWKNAHARTVSFFAERYVHGDLTTGSPLSGLSPWIVEGPESNSRALTPPHASV